jgi:hypothetical protein
MSENRSESERPITRRDLPAVVRRAAELAAVDDETSDELSEQEVIRIAAELGLSERHVRQALYEGVKEEEPPAFLDRYLPPPRFDVSRAIPMEAQKAQRVLADYFVAHEYMQVVRRQAETTTFEPASDAFSKVARGFQRSSKHQLARALHLELKVRSLEPGWSHVRVRAIHKDERTSNIVGFVAGSIFLGVPAGAGLGAIAGGMVGGMAGSEVAIATGALVGITTFTGVAAGFFKSMKSRYRRWRERTMLEAESLLDRAEKGDELRPPPAPWIKKLQMKFGQL